MQNLRFERKSFFWELNCKVFYFGKFITGILKKKKKKRLCQPDIELLDLQTNDLYILHVLCNFIKCHWGKKTGICYFNKNFSRIKCSKLHFSETHHVRCK